MSGSYTGCLVRWAKRIIAFYVGFVLIFTCPNIHLFKEKDVDFYICKSGDGIHDLMLDSPLYPLWTKVIDPSVHVLRKKGYPVLRKVSRTIVKKFGPICEKASVHSQSYFESAQEKLLELHELHLAPTIQNLHTETQKVYNQYKPTIDKHSSNIETVYSQNVKPHVVKASSAFQEFLKANTPKSVYDKIEQAEQFIADEFDLSRSTLPSKFHAFMKHQFLPNFYNKANTLYNHAQELYRQGEESFYGTEAGAYVKDKKDSLNAFVKDPESPYNKYSEKAIKYYEQATNLISEKVDEYLADPANLDGEEKLAEAFFHESATEKVTPTPKTTGKATGKPAPPPKSTKQVETPKSKPTNTAATTPSPTGAPKVNVEKPAADSKPSKDTKKDSPADNESPKARSAKVPVDNKVPEVNEEKVPVKKDTPKVKAKAPVNDSPKAKKAPVTDDTPKVKKEKVPVKDETHKIKKEKAPVKDENPKVKKEKVPIKEESPKFKKEKVPAKEEAPKVKKEKAPVKDETSKVKKEKAPVKEEAPKAKTAKVNTDKVSKEQVPKASEEKVEVTPPPKKANGASKVNQDTKAKVPTDAKPKVKAPKVSTPQGKKVDTREDEKDEL